ncbi:prolyl oligopeptidase family serine peptidase [Tessaracoccus lacteus]|uniref:Prolyl oligopeptidase family serine peptidase n=1 Tax=Tessaracoccus lacteus TaxID=3041766 RepID=A0ABY8PUC5_9ACTN|nr:prolyl oligopeptidase family serine peptidase [Tessaracoccus sp. T21]WGT46042.1 prolyl oligopeptidase family serine peptidase [Tessaracoccus sp. T21]
MTDPTPSPWFDLDTYISTPRLGGLTLSRDGSSLVVAVQGTDAEATAYTTALCRVDPTGETPSTRLTRSVKGESLSAFLPDGSLLFTSKRDLLGKAGDKPSETTAALWCLPAGGGEAYELARRDGGWGQVLTTDSDRVILGVPVHQGAADDEADSAKRTARRDKKVAALLHTGYPVRYWDHDLGQETTRLRVGRVTAEGDRELADVEDLTGDVGRALGDVAVSRDGSLIVAEWSVPEAHGVTRAELVRIDSATGEQTVIASHADDEFGTPVVSDDGSLIVAVRNRRSTSALSPDATLWLIDGDGESRPLAADWDRWAHPVAFTPDNATLIVTADDDGECPVFAIDVATGEVRRLTQHGAYSSVQLSPDGATAYAVRTAYDIPGEVVAIDIAGATTRVLPGPVEYPALPGRIERVETTAADGTRIPGWLVLPDGASHDNPAPLTLWVHGGPLGSWNAWSWRWCPWLLVSRGQAVLLPDPALSTGYGLDHIQRGWGRWGAEPFTDIMALTDAAEARDDVRDDASVMMGGSFGGYMANWIATHTDRFAAIVSHASLWNLQSFGPTTDASWYWKRELSEEMMAAHSPHLFAADIVTPMLVIHGDRDYRVPIGEGLALWWALNEKHEGEPADLPHRFLYFPDENHWILSPQHAKVWYDTVIEFLAAHREGRAMETPELL